MRWVSKLILFLICSQLWSQEDIIPEGVFTITGGGELERWGNIVMHLEHPEIGSKIHIDQESITFLGKRLEITSRYHIRYTEAELQDEWRGSGQKPFSFAEIGFHGTILDSYKIHPDTRYLTLEEKDKYRINEIMRISDEKYLFLNSGKFLFCEVLGATEEG
jgi:hypothetical protein